MIANLHNWKIVKGKNIIFLHGVSAQCLPIKIRCLIATLVGLCMDNEQIAFCIECMGWIEKRN